MASYSKLAIVLNGIVQNLDLSANEIVFGTIKLGGGSGTSLNKTQLDSLLANSHASGSDNQNIIAGIGLSGGGSGASPQIDLDITDLTAETSIADTDLVAIYDTSAAAMRKMTKANFVSGLAAADEKVKGSSNDTTAGYLEDKISVSHGTNTSTILEKSTLNDGANEVVQIQLDQAKIDHGSIAGLGDDDHSQYHNDARGDARYFQKSEHINSSAGAGDAGKPIKLDANGKVNSNMLPAIAITDTFVVASQVAMLALTAQTGDVAVRTDLNKSFILAGSDPTVLGDWQELLSPPDAVQSVNGSTGTVTVNAINELTGDITAGPASGSQSKVATIANSAVTTAKIDAAAVTAAKLGSDVAGDGLGGGNGTPISVNVDGATLEINTDNVRIKDLGVSTAKLAATSVTAAKLGSDVAGTGLSGGNGAAIALNHDNSSLVIDAQSKASVAFVKSAVVAGGTIAANAMAQIDTSGKMVAAQADAIANCQGISGASLAAYSLDDAGYMRQMGKQTVLVQTGITLAAGDRLFLSASEAGKVTNVAPSANNSVIVYLGVAVSSSVAIIGSPQIVAINIA